MLPTRSKELVKYLSEKITTLGNDLTNVQDKNQSWFIARALLEICVIQTQCMAAVIGDQQEQKDEYEFHITREHADFREEE